MSGPETESVPAVLAVEHSALQSARGSTVLDSSGRILGSFHDPTGRVHRLTNVLPTATGLYLGSAEEGGIGRLQPLPEAYKPTQIPQLT